VRVILLPASHRSREVTPYLWDPQAYRIYLQANSQGIDLILQQFQDQRYGPDIAIERFKFLN
jgi:hypothetical protein